MFTSRVGELDSYPGDTTRTMSMAGSCSAVLKHNAPVMIEVRLPGNSSEESSALTLCNSIDENNIENGYALDVCGRTLFNDLDIPSVGRVMTLARASSDWVNVAGNGSYFDGTRVSSRTASSAGTMAVRVYLPRSAGKDPNVRTGDVIAYMLDANRDAVAQSGYLDDEIGTIKYVDYSDSVVQLGWSAIGQAMSPRGLSVGETLLAEVDYTAEHLHNGSTTVDPSGNGILPGIDGDTDARSWGMSSTSVPCNGDDVPLDGDPSVEIDSTIIALEHLDDHGLLTLACNNQMHSNVIDKAVIGCSSYPFDFFVTSDGANVLPADRTTATSHYHSIDCETVASCLFVSSSDVCGDLVFDPDPHTHSGPLHSHHFSNSPSGSIDRTLTSSHNHIQFGDPSLAIPPFLVVNIIQRTS